MRSLLSVIGAILIGTSALFLSPDSIAYANFHCMRIHAIMGGFNGNNNVQYVELRMTTGGQGVLSGHTIQFWDGSNVLKATFTFPANVSNAIFGDSILIATSDFNAIATDGVANFTFAGNTTGTAPDLNHPIQTPNGKVVFQPLPVFNCGNPVSEVDSVAYGTGTPNFGSAAAALPSDNRALVLDTGLVYPPSDSSVKNHLAAVSAVAPFSVTSGNLSTNISTPRNNARRVLKLPSGVGGISEAPEPGGVSSAAVDDSGDGRWIGYAIASTAAALALTCGAGWYVYRRRVA